MDKDKKDELCLTEQFNDIFADENSQIDEEDFKKYENIKMTYDEYVVYNRFYEKHKACLRLPDGRPRFGAIGGGISNILYIDNGNITLIAKCHYCGETVNITESAKDNLYITDDERAVVDKDYKHYANIGGFTRTEYLRMKKFMEGRENHRIALGFMGTGLGYIINLEDETTGEYADVTDTTCW